MSAPIIRTPRYLTRFRCIGAECEDSCCSGWQNVDVDAASFDRYAQLGHSELGPLLRQQVVLNEDPAAGPEDFGLIAVPEGGCCPVLAGDGLCAIQRELGEALLPASCDSFPRQAVLIDGIVEVVGRFACPEVVRLALLAPDGLDLVTVEPDRRLRERARYWVEVPWSGDLAEDDPRRQYHQLRGLCVEVLRRPEVPLEVRLVALGGALANLSAWPGADEEALRRVFEQAARHLAAIQSALEQAAGPVGPADPLLQRLRTWLGMPRVPTRYRACLERVQCGLALPEGPGEPVGAGLAEGYRRGLEHLRAYLERRPYVLENALVNEVCQSNFPYHPERSFSEEAIVLACRYGLLKLHLVGAAVAEGGLTDALVVETVQAFDKYADSPDYWARTLRLVGRDGRVDPSAIAWLVLD